MVPVVAAISSSSLDESTSEIQCRLNQESGRDVTRTGLRTLRKSSSTCAAPENLTKIIPTREKNACSDVTRSKNMGWIHVARPECESITVVWTEHPAEASPIHPGATSLNVCKKMRT